MDWLNTGLWAAQVVLTAVFLMAGFQKAFQYDRAKQTLAWVRDVPRGLVTFIGAAELLGALGMVLPAVTALPSWLTPLAAVGLGLIMLLAAGFHARRGEGQAVALNAVLLLLAAFVAYGRWFVSPL